MTAVLLAAVADTLAEHPSVMETEDSWLCDGPDCWWERTTTEYCESSRRVLATHQAERVVARLTELLPGLPAEDVAALIGGTVAYATLPPVHREGMPPVRGGVWWRARRVIGPWVPDSPSAAEGGE